MFGIGVFGALPAHAEDQTIYEVFSQISEVEKSKKDFRNEIFYALKALSSMDKNLRFAMESKKLVMYYKGRFVLAQDWPTLSDVDNSVLLLNVFFEKAKELSPEISLHDYEAVDEMMAHVVEKRGDGSKYYKSMDLAEDPVVAYRGVYGSVSQNILYVRLSLFDNQTAEKMKELMLKDAQKTVGMILDLRGNPGGSLNAMVDVAKLFLDEGIILLVKDKKSGEEQYLEVKNGENVWKNKALVVLVDGGTASSAEALAASLQEQISATLIGTKTFGKGTVQELVSLDNGSKLALTTEEFFSPSGEKLDKKGVVPDICLSFMGDKQKAESVILHPKRVDCPKENREKQKLDEEAARVLILKKN